MKVALIYDRINKIGGAEKVLEAMHEIWPDAPVFTAVYNQSTSQWSQGWKINPSFLNKLPFKKNHEVLFKFTPYAFESFDFDYYDIVISITSAEAKSIITKPHTLHVCYLLTPPKYLWSHTHIYQKTNPMGNVGELILKLILPLSRKYDIYASRLPDVIIPISNHIKKRIKKVYKINCEQIIYPPVSIPESSFVPQEKDYYLIVSRLVPSKRVAEIVNAFSGVDKNLVIIGTGIELKTLKSLASNKIIFKESVNDAMLHGYYKHAKAFIFPQEEDFGIAAVEAQMHGLPVIAYSKGSSREILNQNTGCFFDDYSIHSILDAIEQYETKKWDRELITKNAQQFTKAKFMCTIKAYMEELWIKHRQNLG